ncbi:MAG TPA: prolyl oligopeptidase family serine peptidase [Pedobacter sp.]|jgi:dipeptidyl aminopeptidase/acylaminoacyl peptidase
MKSKVYLPLLIALFVFGLASCKKNKDPEPIKEEVFLDTAYSSNEENTMDVYLPLKRSDSTKVIFLLHGGSWATGDKDSLTQLAVFLKDKGFAVVNMNYRLTGTNPANIHPAQQNDIKAAINFVASKAFNWHISSDKYGMLGVSAGAHLALLYTYAYNTNNKIKTVASLSGPTNFTDPRGIGFPQAAAVAALLGASFEANPTLYREASPLSKVNSLSKPTLIIHGNFDSVVPAHQATDLYAKLNLFNVKSDLLLYNTGHDLYNDANKQEILNKITSWFSGNIK